MDLPLFPGSTRPRLKRCGGGWQPSRVWKGSLKTFAKVLSVVLCQSSMGAAALGPKPVSTASTRAVKRLLGFSASVYGRRRVLNTVGVAMVAMIRFFVK